jgi:hypothetical protein
MIDIIRAIRKMPLDHLDKNTQRRIVSKSRKYFWDSPYLFKLGNDGVMRRCVPREERVEILRKCHSTEYGVHYSHFRTQAKVWSSGFYWPEMHEDTKKYVASCPECQMLTVKFRQPSHEFTFGVDMSFILYPLVITPLI